MNCIYCTKLEPFSSGNWTNESALQVFGQVAGRNADSVLPKLFSGEKDLAKHSALFQNGEDLVLAAQEECAADKIFTK